MVTAFLYEYLTVLKEDGQDEKISRQPFYVFAGTVQHVCTDQRFC
ncbi:conserved hypothetical protein [Xenorhabdus cabanillasii JM26]|uniref:Uncharacterized protein n=1 Tax=Xenorhabdus cabanillasii JM26 TaxID=1427517 RepID=W1IPH6_9GAMM|nr:conserved hypothetical protein [Xenorhabdus cabanillasii JM26]